MPCFSRSALLLYLIYFLCVTPSQACELLQKGIKRKIEDYKVVQQKNVRQLEALLSTETDCQSNGASISGRIAQLAEARSCEAQLDASKIDKQMGDLGERCETHFKKINALQVTLRLAFEEVKMNLEGGLDYMSGALDLPSACGEEIQFTRNMVTKFLALERDIYAVEGRSIDGKDNYGKFKETARSLRDLTQNRNQSCGTAVAALAGIFDQASLRGKGSGAPVPDGKSSAPNSEITGKLQSRSLESFAASNQSSQDSLPVAIGAPRAPLESTVTGGAQGGLARNQGRATGPARELASLTSDPTERSPPPAPFGSALSIVADLWNSSMEKDSAREKRTEPASAASQRSGILALSREPEDPSTGHSEGRALSALQIESAKAGDVVALGVVNGESVPTHGVHAFHSTANEISAADLFTKVSNTYRRWEPRMQRGP